MLRIPFKRTDRYDKHIESNASGLLPCVICGRGIHPDKVEYVVCVDPSEDVAIPWGEVANTDTGACRPIGYDCWRKNSDLRPVTLQRRDVRA